MWIRRHNFLPASSWNLLNAEESTHLHDDDDDDDEDDDHLRDDKARIVEINKRILK